MREFTRANVSQLTVHHRDHNHDNNPPDGSNWELLCLYCHDNEHSRYLEADRGAGITVRGGQAGHPQPLCRAKRYAQVGRVALRWARGAHPRSAPRFDRIRLFPTPRLALRRTPGCRRCTRTGIVSFGPKRPDRISLRQRIFDLLLDRPLQRPRAIHRIEARLRDLLQRLVVDTSSVISILARRFSRMLQLDLGDGADVLLVERMEHHDLVDAVDELGPEMRRAPRPSPPA